MPIGVSSMCIVTSGWLRGEILPGCRWLAEWICPIWIGHENRWSGTLARKGNYKRKISGILTDHQQELADQAMHCLNACSIPWSWKRVRELADEIGISPLEAIMAIGRAASRRKKNWYYPTVMEKAFEKARGER